MNLTIRSTTKPPSATAVVAGPRLWAPVGLAALAVLPVIAPGLAFAALSAAGLLAVMTRLGGRSALTNLKGLPWLALGAALGLAALVLAMTPLTIGGVHPLWAPVGKGGGAVIDREGALAGTLTLAGLLLFFLLAAVTGARSERARQTSQALLAVLTVTELGLIGAQLFKLNPPAGLAAFIAGLILLLASASLVQARKAERPRGWLGPIRIAPGSAALIVLSGVALGVEGGVQAVAAAGCALILFHSWEALAGGGEGKMRRGPLLTVLGLLAAAALAVTVSTLIWAQPTAGSPQAISDAVHWKAALASPFAGYGAGSAEAVAHLSMDRLTLSALQLFPRPSSAYLSLFEQAGALALIPFVLVLGYAAWSLIDASVRRRRLTTAYRASVAALLFALLDAAVSPAPATLAGAAPLILLLGCAFGAARANR